MTRARHHLRHHLRSALRHLATGCALYGLTHTGAPTTAADEVRTAWTTAPIPGAAIALHTATRQDRHP